MIKIKLNHKTKKNKYKNLLLSVIIAIFGFVGRIILEIDCYKPNKMPIAESCNPLITFFFFITIAGVVLLILRLDNINASNFYELFKKK